MESDEGKGAGKERIVTMNHLNSKKLRVRDYPYRYFAEGKKEN